MKLQIACIRYPSFMGVNKTPDQRLPGGELLRLLGAARKEEGHASTTCFLERDPDIVFTRLPSPDSMILSAKDGANGPQSANFLDTHCTGHREGKR